MGLYCVAYGCKERFIKGGPHTFHSFPKDAEKRKLWEKQLRRENFTATNYSKICSKHFTNDCFDSKKFGGTWLKSDAIPTIFDFPQHLQKKDHTRKAPMKRMRTSDDISVDCLNGEGSSVDYPIRKKRLHFLGDFDADDVTSPSKAQKLLEISQNQVSNFKRTVRNINRKNQRLKKRVESLSNMINELEKKRLISEAATAVLKLSVPEGAAAEFLKRLNVKDSREKYPPELRAFALTLNFYSAKAYNYVRKTFDCNLPHPTTLRKWYGCIDGSAGFTKEAFAALKIKAQEAKVKNSSVKGCLIVDEMAIRSHIEWDKNKFLGYIDLGTELDDDQLPHAKEVLVFMVNSINSSWKVPVGYFLINGLTALERANLITEALRQIDETGIDVVALTFDGNSSNIAAANALGANLTFKNLINFFSHPVTSRPVYIILDVCHMLKLVRNCLASKGCLYDEDLGIINWNFIVELEKIQKEEGLHAATKLRTRHIQWYREKMKVKLAAQVLSKSVADALAYLASDLKHEKFQGCEATIHFLQMFNDLFDMLNSKNLLGKGYKAPFQAKNKECFVRFIDEAESYIKNLKITKNGQPVLLSNRKTGFLGFLVTIKSIKSLYISLCESNHMKFLLTYKFSQDHLELFFSAIRSKGGHNNNPTAKQFKAAYVRLVAHHEIMTSDSANCAILDTTNIVNLTSCKNMYLSSINATDATISDSRPLNNIESVLEDHNYTSMGHTLSNGFRHLTEYVTSVVGYIAGFVIKKLKSTLKCRQCISVIYESPQNVSKLIVRKNCGGLSFPSDDVTHICKLGEKVFRIAHASGKLIRRNIMHLLIIQGLNEVMSRNPNIFSNLKDHSFDHSPLDDHRVFLIKAIFFEYFKIRLTHAGKGITEQLQSNRVRSINSKTTIFKGQ